MNAERVVTLHQPWASLVMLGRKTIETRTWPTRYRGRLWIHAAKTTATWRRLDAPYLMTEREQIQAVLEALGVMADDGTSWPSADIWDPEAIRLGDLDLPLGAIIGSVDLVDCVPMIALDNDHPHNENPGPWRGVVDYRYGAPDLWIVDYDADRQGGGNGLEHERLFGDYVPGNHAWVLADPTPCAVPFYCRGRQGLWPLPDGVAA